MTATPVSTQGFFETASGGSWSARPSMERYWLVFQGRRCRGSHCRRSEGLGTTAAGCLLLVERVGVCRKTLQRANRSCCRSVGKPIKAVRTEGGNAIFAFKCSGACGEYLLLDGTNSPPMVGDFVRRFMPDPLPGSLRLISAEPGGPQRWR